MDQPRAEERCDRCGITDTAPKHHLADADPANPGFLAVISRHFECCAAEGCPDGTCNQILAEAKARVP